MPYVKFIANVRIDVIDEINRIRNEFGSKHKNKVTAGDVLEHVLFKRDLESVRTARLQEISNKNVAPEPAIAPSKAAENAQNPIEKVTITTKTVQEPIENVQKPIENMDKPKVLSKNWLEQ